MRRTLLAAAALVSLGTAPALRAQAATPATAATKPATAGAQQAARELLQLMDMPTQMRAGMSAMLDAQVKSQPLMAPYRATMQAWADKYFVWPELESRMTQIYLDHFTEGELRDLVTFYRTPTGHKLVSVNPELTRLGAEAGQEIGAAHAADLQQMIQARSEELSKGGTP